MTTDNDLDTTKKPKRRKLYWIVGVAAVVVVAFIVKAVIPGGGDELNTHQVVRGTIQEIVGETGKVVASEDVDLFFKSSGRVAEIFVKEGDIVEKGQEIMALETSELRIKRREASAALASAQAKYSQALAGATAEEISIAEVAVQNAETTLASARQSLEDQRNSNVASLDKAYADLDGYLESLFQKSAAAKQTLGKEVFNAYGDLRSEILATDGIATTEAAAAFQKALLDLDDMESDMAALRATSDQNEIDALVPRIISQGQSIRDAAAKSSTLLESAIAGTGLTATELDTRRTNVKTAWSDVNTAINNAESQKLYIASTKASNAALLNTKQQAVSTAEGSLLSARESLASKRAPLRDVDKAVYLAAISSARANYDLIGQQISDATLKAPVTGIVGTLDLDPGELATATVRAASMISSMFEIESDVSELDIAQITPGSPVEATFDALGNEVFSGQVIEIAAREKDEDGDIFYTVTAVLDSDEVPLRSGMTADLDIKTGEISGVLIVPRKAVLRRDGNNYLQALRNGKTEEVQITVGLKSRDVYEVLSGISEGESIVLPNS